MGNAEPLPSASRRAATTSRYSGSPTRRAPWCGRARRSTCTVAGSAADEVLDRERPVQAHLDHADLLACGQQVIRPSRAPSPRRNPSMTITRSASGCADVIEQAGTGGRSAARIVHRRLHDLRARRRRTVAGLAGLEEDVGILRRAAHDGMVGVRARAADAPNGLVVDHGRGCRRRCSMLDLADFVRGAESVEEMQERHAGFQVAAWAISARSMRLLDASWSRAWRSRSGGRPSRRSGRRRSTARAWPARAR